MCVWVLDKREEDDRRRVLDVLVVLGSFENAEWGTQLCAVRHDLEAAVGGLLLVVGVLIVR